MGADIATNCHNDIELNHSRAKMSNLKKKLFKQKVSQPEICNMAHSSIIFSVAISMFPGVTEEIAGGTVCSVAGFQPPGGRLILIGIDPGSVQMKYSIALCCG